MRIHLLTVALIPTLALAQDKDKPPTGPHGQFGIDFTTQYFFRGLLQENQGIIAQPHVELTYDLLETKDTVRDLDVTFGLWNSVHSGPTGGSGGVWYESDFYVDVGSKVGERWKLDARYTAYDSPNGSFNTIQEISFAGHYDDKGHSFLFDLENGLQPSVLIAFETAGERDGGNHPGTYVQAGIEPSWDIGKLGSSDLKFSVPATVGLSLANYYEKLNVGGSGDAFGFLDVGAKLSSALTFVPERFGKWNADAALHLLVLGDNTKEFNHNDGQEFIFTFGVSTTW
jgi:hypothetical protein